MSHWLSMGGYALYVWPAYALVLAVLLISVVGIKRQGQQTRKKLQLWYQSDLS